MDKTKTSFTSIKKEELDLLQVLFVQPFSRGGMSDLHLLIDLHSSYSKKDLGQLTCSQSWSILHFQIQELPKGVVGRLLIEPLAPVPGRALRVQMNHGMWVFFLSNLVPQVFQTNTVKTFRNTQRKKEHGTWGRGESASQRIRKISNERFPSQVDYISNEIKEFIMSISERISVKREGNQIISIVAETGSSLKAIKVE